MKISIGSSATDPRCILKQYSPITTITNFYSKKTIDLNSPTLELTIDSIKPGLSSTLKQCNYVILFPDRYSEYCYFLDHYEIEKGDTIKLNLKIDLLMTFRRYIVALIDNQKIISCAEDGYDSLVRNINQPIPDPNVKFGVRSYKDQQIIEFPENALTYNDPYFLLTVAGSYGVFNSTDPSQLNLFDEMEANKNEK